MPRTGGTLDPAIARRDRSQSNKTDIENLTTESFLGRHQPPDRGQRIKPRLQPVHFAAGPVRRSPKPYRRSRRSKRDGAGLACSPIRAVRIDGQADDLGKRRARFDKPVSQPNTAFIPPGTYTFTVLSYGVDSGQAATVQLVPGTQTYLEVQLVRSWAIVGENGQRDTLCVRAISPHWVEKYSPR
jgi:hypothetical protein